MQDSELCQIGIQHSVTIGIEIERFHGGGWWNQARDLFGFDTAEAEPQEGLYAALSTNRPTLWIVAAKPVVSVPMPSKPKPLNPVHRRFHRLVQMRAHPLPVRETKT